MSGNRVARTIRGDASSSEQLKAIAPSGPRSRELSAPLTAEDIDVPEVGAGREVFRSRRQYGRWRHCPRYVVGIGHHDSSGTAAQKAAASSRT
ncbi:hypothetical protein GCM10018777_69950 [Streptomyces albogriseolus]|nr:hypothetical protein GCM10018777_69950 [Streptomyces viridodiastaticus]